MHHRSLLPAVLLMASAMLSAAEGGMPEGLPHERVVLRDGRHLTGHYDEAQGILWLNGAGNPRLRVIPDDIVKRTPIVADNDQKTPRAPAEKPSRSRPRRPRQSPCNWQWLRLNANLPTLSARWSNPARN